MKALNSRGEVRGLTGEELLGLPAAIDLDTANRALMIGRSTGYALARQGRYPVRVLRLGNAYRVVTAACCGCSAWSGSTRTVAKAGQAKGSARPRWSPRVCCESGSRS